MRACHRLQESERKSGRFGECGSAQYLASSTTNAPRCCPDSSGWSCCAGMGINPVARSDSHPNLTTATVRCPPRLNPFSVTLTCPNPFGMTLTCPERISDRSGGVRSIVTGSFRCLHIVHPHSTCHVPLLAHGTRRQEAGVGEVDQS